MELVKIGPQRWCLKSSYDERHIPKGYGFRWDPDNRRWWTGQIDVAVKASRYASEALEAELTGNAIRVTKEELAAVEASRATDAEIDVPAPPGWSFLPYQRAGVAFALRKKHCLIADQMGLGKTPMSIGVVNSDDTVKRVLVICPASIKLNWQKELTRWLTRPMTIGIAFSAFVPMDRDIVIINYDIVGKNRDLLMKTEWDMMVVDECHLLKNPKAQRTAAILGTARTKNGPGVTPIPARRKIFLTGTPILNRPAELWPLVRALDPDGLGKSYKHYHTRYCAGRMDGGRFDASGASHMDELQHKLRANVMIRRLKADVLKDLPPKRRQVVEITPEGDAIEVVAREREAYDRRAAKIAEAEAAVRKAEDEENDEAYKDAVKTLKGIEKLVFEEISALRRDTAIAKIPAAIEFVREAVEASGKVVFFAHHLAVIDAIMREFQTEFGAVKLTGQTPNEDRQKAVDRFQNDPGCRLFAGNILAAGVGITLTAASHVVFSELDWRPGMMTQAEDRCHRIGQLDSVLVQHLVFDNSLDAVMAKTIIAKQAVIESVLDKETGYTPPKMVVVDPVAEEAEARARSQQAAQPAREPLPDIPPPDMIPAIHRALRLVASYDADHARVVNGAGFSKTDGVFGHSLASAPRLSPKQAAWGYKLVRKYRGQLPANLVQELRLA